jgi:hypothetical protein
VYDVCIDCVLSSYYYYCIVVVGLLFDYLLVIAGHWSLVIGHLRRHGAAWGGIDMFHDTART